MDWDESRMAEPSLLKYNVHTPLQSLSVDKIKQLSAVTALPGMSIRTAVILGCSDVWVVGRRRYDRRSVVGAVHYINVHRFPAISPTYFAENRLIPIVIEQGGQALEEFSFKSMLPGHIEPGWRVVFIVGSESFGLPASFMKALAAPIVTISQYGVIRSLNVSAATSIVLYEYSRQWRASRAV
jgi:tRNA G18 (ribose-2'-O)-methylase SpoU